MSPQVQIIYANNSVLKLTWYLKVSDYLLVVSLLLFGYNS